jgi:hypothetical protein
MTLHTLPLASAQPKDFVSAYMDYVNIEQGEAPAVYHRWSCISMLSACLGRKVWLPFGHSKIYPNQYIMLMGSPGTRKNTALNIAKRIAMDAGFERFAAERSSLERFIMDMRAYDVSKDTDLEDIMNLTLDGPDESYVMHGEFTDFIGRGNIDFVLLLTNLWDNLPTYKHPKIHGKSIEVNEPTVNILGGNTPGNFALALPPEAVGSGFLSRVIFVHSDPTGKQVTWPEPADELVHAALASRLKEMRDTMTGEIQLSKEVRILGEKIYKGFVPIDDARFAHYSQRRFTHVLKISIVLAVADGSMVLKPVHMIRANTVLAQAEKLMPRALGEFGKNRNSDVANTVLEYLNKSTKPRVINEIFKVVSTDIARSSDLADILNNLQRAEKIQVVTMAGKTGYMSKFVHRTTWDDSLLDLAWLTEEERAV